MSRIDEIESQIATLQSELTAIRAACSHPAPCRLYKLCGNTGNYDPSADCYWIDHQCTLCGVRWTTDQSPENRAPEGAKRIT